MFINYYIGFCYKQIIVDTTNTPTLTPGSVSTSSPVPSFFFPSFSPSPSFCDDELWWSDHSSSVWLMWESRGREVTLRSALLRLMMMDCSVMGRSQCGGGILCSASSSVCGQWGRAQCTPCSTRPLLLSALLSVWPISLEATGTLFVWVCLWR